MLVKFSHYTVWCFGIASPWRIDELDSTLWKFSILEQTPDTVQATSWRWPCSPMGWLFPSGSVNIFLWLWSSSGISTDIRKMRGNQAWDFQREVMKIIQGTLSSSVGTGHFCCRPWIRREGRWIGECCPSSGTGGNSCFDNPLELRNRLLWGPIWPWSRPDVGCLWGFWYPLTWNAPCWHNGSRTASWGPASIFLPSLAQWTLDCLAKIDFLHCFLCNQFCNLPIQCLLFFLGSVVCGIGVLHWKFWVKIDQIPGNCLAYPAVLRQQ